jgi:hypothetical protein
MKLKSWMLTAAVAALAACGNAGSDKNNATDSASTTETSTMTTKTSIEVPATTRTSFETKYPKATDVSWSHYQATTIPIEWEWTGWPPMDTSDYVASFNVDGSDYWVWYDDGGDWVGTVTEITNSGLPAAVNNVIRSQYAGYTVVSAEKENDKNRTVYEIKMENGKDKMKLLVDENGNILKKKGIVNDQKIKEKTVKDSVM